MHIILNQIELRYFSKNYSESSENQAHVASIFLNIFDQLLKTSTSLRW